MSRFTRALGFFSAVLPAALLCGCHGYASVFAQAGPAARAIGKLGIWVMVGLSVVAVVVTVLIVWASLRRNGTLQEHAPVDVGGGQYWILIGGFAIPALVLSVILYGTLHTANRFPLHDQAHYRADIRLVGRQWWWEVDYDGGAGATRIITANEIHVPIGWPVEIELESRDVIHSFWVPALHGKVDLVPGRLNHIQIQADVAGRYEGQCAEYCGSEHTRMNFVLIAEPLPVYEAWLAHQAAPASSPGDPEAAAGKALFESHACGLCHTVRGTSALGSVGPYLTHFASREGLAANSYPKTRAYLEAWITHAQSLKPGSQMPDLTQFGGAELQALTHYVEGLH